MLRMEIVGPDSAVTARRQIINFSLDAKRIPLSVCSPPPSTPVCLPFFASVVSSIGLSLSRCLFDFAKWKNFSRMQEEKLTGGRGSRPCRLPLSFYSNFFLLPLLEYFHSDARLDARLPYSLPIPTPYEILASSPRRKNVYENVPFSFSFRPVSSPFFPLCVTSSFSRYKFPRLEVTLYGITTWHAKLT